MSRAYAKEEYIRKDRNAGISITIHILGRKDSNAGISITSHILERKDSNAGITITSYILERMKRNAGISIASHKGSKLGGTRDKSFLFFFPSSSRQT